MKTGILFDLDGTLLDTLEDLWASTNFALSSMGYPQRSLEEVRQFVGNGALRLIARAVPEGGDTEETLRRFREHYDAHCRVRTRPYVGILEALDAVREKYPVAIVSNKPDAAVKILSRDYFSGIFARGEDSDCPRKPAPDMVRQAMAAIGVERCVYVGDSEVDVLTAKNAGVPCLCVLWGFRNREELVEAGAEYFCGSTADLPAAIDRICKEKLNGK